MKNNKRTAVYLVIFFVLSVFITTSCEDDNILIQDSMVELDIKGDGVSALKFSADGGIKDIRLKSDDYWTVECDAPWCMVSPANGKAGTVCEVHVDSTSTYEPREAKIVFRSGAFSKEITISQETYGKVLVLTDSLTSILPEYADDDKSYFTLTVKANVEFKVDSKDQWITPQKFVYKESVIPREYKLKFQYDPSFVPQERSSAITVQALDGSRSVNYVIKQNAAPKIEDNRRGDSLALIGFARGLRSFVPWDHSKSMLHWVGVTLGEELICDKNGNILKTKSGKDSTDVRVVGLQMTLFNTNKTLPEEIKYLTHLKHLSLTGNDNGFLKRIKLGPEVASLDSLRVLSLLGYGISELDPALATMKSLEVLSLSENLLKIPQEIIEPLYRKHLRHINFSGNRRRDGILDLSLFSNVMDTIGISQTLHEDLIWLFRLEDMRSIGLSYNYLRGNIPTQEQIYPGEPSKAVLPRCKGLGLNLNFLSGSIPEWMLNHKHICAWDPFTMTFYQEGKNENGKKVGFTNEPDSETLHCEDYDWSQPDEDYLFWTQQEKLGLTFDQYVKGYRIYFK